MPPMAAERESKRGICIGAPIEEVPQETMCNDADFPPKRKADGSVVRDSVSASGPRSIRRVCERKFSVLTI